MQKYIILLACITFISTMSSCASSCHSSKNTKESETQDQDASNDKTSNDDTVKQDDKGSETGSANAADDKSPDSSDGNSDAHIVKQDAADQKVELCTEGNCPCGDGFCAKNSVCIKDMCFCGAFPDYGFIDEGAVASNLYGEFECVRYYYQEGCAEEYNYDFICKRAEGCKTGDGRNYPLSKKSSGTSVYDRDIEKGWNYQNEEEENPDLHIAFDGKNAAEEVLIYLDSNDDEDMENREKYLPYEKLIKDRYLNHCGKKLPDSLKFVVRSDLSKLPTELELIDFSDLEHEFEGRPYWCNLTQAEKINDFVSPSYLECALRKSCSDNGVSSEYIMEYVCEFGIAQHIGFTQKGKEHIALRCNQSAGCTCGSTQCPQHAICKGGVCKYDIYYEHRVCPEKGWNAAKSDLENYILSSNAEKCPCGEDAYDEECFDECMHEGEDTDKNKEYCKDRCALDEESRKNCYEECYWNHYESTMTATNPCEKSK